MAIITVSGSQNVGKTTYIRDFIETWPMYSTPKYTYRDIIKERGLDINKNTNIITQEIILNSLCEAIESYNKNDNIIFDRSPLDNLAYSIYAYENNIGNITGQFIAESIAKVKKALKKVDLMLYIPILSNDTFEMTNSDNELRSIDPIFRSSIDNLLHGFCELRVNNDPTFFDINDCSPIIEVFGSRDERISITKLYITEDGGFYGENESLLLDINGNPFSTCNESNIDTGERKQLMEQLGLEVNNGFNIMK